MTRALLGLGANLGERENTLKNALSSLNALPGTQVTRVSSLYETAPVGYADQPDFLNAVAEVETELSAHALLGACLGIEAALGRRRSFRNAPRVVDIDLLRFGSLHCNQPELILPHPRMEERAFVLIPLAELFPDKKIDGWDFAPCLEKTSTKDVRCFSTFST